MGAGVMGAWTAYLAQKSGGRSVTLLDAWGPANARSTSGDETRITRAAHGPDRLYTRWSRRSLELWKRFAAEHGIVIFVPSGVLWFAHRADGFEAASIPALDAEGVPYERPAPDEVRRRWAQIGIDDGLAACLYEPDAGALMARRGTRAAAAAVGASGGTITRAAVRPGRARGGRLLDVRDASGRGWSAATFVFAAGPWLPRLFPEVLGDVIRVTKQDVVHVGPAAGDGRFHARALPAWCDFDAAYYGIPAIDGGGFKLAPDGYGSEPVGAPVTPRRHTGSSVSRASCDGIRPAPASPKPGRE